MLKRRWCRRPPPPGHSHSIIERFPAAPVPSACIPILGPKCYAALGKVKGFEEKETTEMSALRLRRGRSKNPNPNPRPSPPASPSPAPTVSERMTTVMAWHITASHKALGSLCVGCRRSRRKPRPLAPSAARLRM